MWWHSRVVGGSGGGGGGACTSAWQLRCPRLLAVLFAASPSAGQLWSNCCSQMGRRQSKSGNAATELRAGVSAHPRHALLGRCQRGPRAHRCKHSHAAQQPSQGAILGHLREGGESGVMLMPCKRGGSGRSTSGQPLLDGLTWVNWSRQGSGLAVPSSQMLHHAQGERGAGGQAGRPAAAAARRGGASGAAGRSGRRRWRSACGPRRPSAGIAAHAQPVQAAPDHSQLVLLHERLAGRQGLGQWAAAASPDHHHLPGSACPAGQGCQAAHSCGRVSRWRAEPGRGLPGGLEGSRCAITTGEGARRMGLHWRRRATWRGGAGGAGGAGGLGAACYLLLHTPPAHEGCLKFLLPCGVTHDSAPTSHGCRQTARIDVPNVAAGNRAVASTSKRRRGQAPMPKPKHAQRASNRQRPLQPAPYCCCCAPCIVRLPARPVTPPPAKPVHDRPQHAKPPDTHW